MGPLVDHTKPQTDVWETCRRALRDWYGLEVHEDHPTTEKWCRMIEGLPVNLDRVRPLIAFTAMLKRSDPDHVTGLAAECRILEPFEALILFRNADAMEVGFGIQLHNEDAPQIIGFDFDEPVHYKRLSRIPETFVSAYTIEAFALGILIDGFTPDHALMAMAEHDDIDSSLEILTAAFGPARQFDEMWLFGNEQILIAVRGFPALGGYRIDLVALSEAACRPLSEEILSTLNFPRRIVTAHHWNA